MKLRTLALPFVVFLLPCLALAQGSCSGTGTLIGSASFNHNIEWELTGDLYFNINNGPPNTCGALVITRNGGSPQCTPGWVCTDANGNASKGPWTWAGQNGDEAGTDVHINWSDGSTTQATTNAYWDKTCPTPTITSTGTPPSLFTGTGTDGVGGAGFSTSWTLIKVTYKDVGTGLYYDPSTGDYTASAPPLILGTISSGSGTIGPGTNDSPSYNMTWSAPTPPRTIHVQGNSYDWTVSLGESESRCIDANASSTALHSFTIPSGGGGCPDCCPDCRPNRN